MANKTQTPKRATKKSVAPPQPAPPMKEGVAERNGKPTEEDIRIRAYQKWQAAGCPSGDGAEFWLQAERELKAP